MCAQSNNWQQSGSKKEKCSHLLFNPEPFLCGCGDTPVVKKGNHPESEKGGYFVVQCRCGRQSIYAKERYKSILDWNTKPISQDTGDLTCPGLNMEGLNLHDALDAILEESSRLRMVLAEKGQPHMDSGQWRILKAQYGWYQMLIAVMKRRLNKRNECTTSIY